MTTDEGKTLTPRSSAPIKSTDLALLKIEGRKDFPFVKFAGDVAARRRLGASPSAIRSASAAR